MKHKQGFLIGFICALVVLLSIAAGLKPTQYVIGILNNFTTNGPNDFSASSWGYWGTNTDGTLTNRSATGIKIAGSGSGHLILTEGTSGGYLDMFQSGTNLYLDLVSTNSGGVLNTNPLTFGNNVTGNLIRLVGTNNTTLLKLMQDGSFYLGSASNFIENAQGISIVGDGNATHLLIVATNPAAAAGIGLYGSAGGFPSGIAGLANGLSLFDTNGIIAGDTLDLTNYVAFFHSNVIATAYSSGSNVFTKMPTNSPVNGQVLQATGTGGDTKWSTVPLLTNALFCTFVGGSALAVGSVAQIPIPYNCTLIDLQMVAYPSGAAVLDLKDCTVANQTMTVGSSIVASAPPTIAATSNGTNDLILTGWTTALTARHSLQASVTSCTTITNLTLTMRVTHAQ